MERVDKYGHCCVCHKNLLIERVVDEKVIHMFTADHSETEFLLNDGSRMRVCMCKKCKENVDLTAPAIQRMIMDCVKEGWQLEVNNLVNDSNRPEWTKERGDKHMRVYNAKEIDCHCDGINEQALKERKNKLFKLLNEVKK